MAIRRWSAVRRMYACASRGRSLELDVAPSAKKGGEGLDGEVRHRFGAGVLLIARAAAG
jgi:hypothetical protein